MKKITSFRVLLVFIAAHLLATGAAWAVTITVDAITNPNTDGTALFQIGPEVGVPTIDEITLVLPETSTTYSGLDISLFKTIQVSGTRYVELALILNEPGSAPGDDFSMTEFKLTVGGTTVYELPVTDTVLFNPSDVINVENGGNNEIEAYILIPESLFQGQGFTLMDTFSLTALFSDLGGGDDLLIFGPGDGTPINLSPTAVPEPATAIPLTLVVVVGFIARQRRLRRS